MKANQLRAIATILNATVTDRRKITALVAGIRNYSETITAGTEKEAIAKLKSAVTIATTYNADQAFILMLKGQIKALTTKVTFGEFKPPYTYVRGTVAYKGTSHKFLCYMDAPSLANQARSIDPTFDATVAPELKNELRELVKAALVKTWNRHRSAITGLNFA
jgi:hypothetical protein